METLAADHPARTGDAPAPALDAVRVRHMAATLIRKRYTPEDVRQHAGGRPQFSYMWSAIADAMDAIGASVPAQRLAPDREAAPA